MAAADPVGTLAEMVCAIARRNGYTDVRPGASLVEEEGIYIDLEVAFTGNGLLPLLVKQAEQIYDESGLSRSTLRYPFEVIAADEDGLVGLAVRWLDGQAALGLALLVAIDALHLLMENNPDAKPVLMVE